jgi:hypothetical protein
VKATRTRSSSMMKQSRSFSGNTAASRTGSTPCTPTLVKPFSRASSLVYGSGHFPLLPAFSGLITCGHCGCAMVDEIKKGRYVYYHCEVMRALLRSLGVPTVQHILNLLPEFGCDQRLLRPVNQPNQGESSPAEVGEGRARTKENSLRTHTSPTQSGERVSQGLSGVRQPYLDATIQGKSRMC